MFSANHRQHLLVALKHFDAMLTEVLERIGSAPGEPVFQSCRNDADDATRERAQIAAMQLRQAMRGFMAQHDLRASAPELGALHSAHAMLALMQVGAVELGGRHLLGYGELSAAEIVKLDTFAERMCKLVVALDGALHEAHR